MKLKKNTQVKSLPDHWFKNISKQEINSEEQYNLLIDPTCKDWVGLKSLASLATRELSYYSAVDECKSISSTDPEPVVQPNSIKTRLLNIAISRSELLSFNEIRVLNLLLEHSRKDVATMLGIKKARLSQIIKSIKDKLERETR
jgi:DNA-directed RNA polymerase specialized sigma subunit